MGRRNIDLILVIACSLLLATIVLVVPFAKPARIVLGLPFIFFFPGYAIMAALFPRKENINAIERLALSLGLSIAVVPLIALALNYSPWGISLNPTLASLTVFIVATAALAMYRRRSLPAEQAVAVVTYIRLPGWFQARMVDKLSALVIVLALVGLGAAVYFAVVSSGGSERFTEFYVLGPGGKAGAYPSLVKVGENATVILGVVNNEGQDTSYRVVVKIDGENSDSIDNLVLEDGERREKRVVLAPTRAGDGQKVEFLLFNERERGTYRSLHLSLDVVGAPPEATPEPEGFVSPGPAASPTATPLPIAAPMVVGPAGLIYPVQPGDTLTAISERFGLSLETIAAANGIAEPGPILTGQELVIPGTVYTVQPGDTLADIAAAFEVAPAPILASNTIADPSAVYSGQELFIPVPIP